MKRFTATTYVFSTDMKKMAFIRHKKLNSWLPPGGHVEENETPTQAALREIMEETGIEAEIIQDTEEFKYADNQAQTLEKPEIILLEKKACGKCPEHVDLIYAARMISQKVKTEQHDMKWVDAIEFEALEPMLENARRIGRHLFKKYGQ